MSYFLAKSKPKMSGRRRWSHTMNVCVNLRPYISNSKVTVPLAPRSKPAAPTTLSIAALSNAGVSEAFNEWYICELMTLLSAPVSTKVLILLFCILTTYVFPLCDPIGTSATVTVSTVHCSFMTSAKGFGKYTYGL